MIFSSYIFKNYLKFYSLILGSVVFLFNIFDFIQKTTPVSYFKTHNPKIIWIIELYLYKTPLFIYQNIPLASLLSAVITMSIMAHKHEITTLRSFGYGPWQCSKPLLAGGLFSCLCSLVLSEIIVPISSEKERYTRVVKIEKRSLSFTNNSKWFKNGNQFIFFSGFKPKNKSLSNLSQIVVDKNFKITKIHQAQRATYSNEGLWKFSSTKVIDTKNLAQIKFSPNLSINLPLSFYDLKQNLLPNENQSIYYNWRKSQKNETASVVSKDSYLLNMHSKIAYILSSLFLVLIAIRAGFVHSRNLNTLKIFIETIITGFLYWISIIISKPLSISSYISPIIGAWIGNITLIIFIVFIFLSLSKIKLRLISLKKSIFSLLLLSVFSYDLYGQKKLAIIFEQQTLKNIKSFHPYSPSTKEQEYLKYLLATPLFNFAHNYNSQRCLLCKNKPLLKDISLSQKTTHLELTIDLDDNIKWSDGVAINYEDLKFSFEVWKKTNLFIRSFKIEKKIELLESKIPGRTLIIKAKTIEYFNLFFRHFVLLPAHIEQEIWLKAKKNINTYLKESLLHSTSQKPITYGPFIIKDFSKDEITLTPKENKENIPQTLLLTEKENSLDKNYQVIVKEKTTLYNNLNNYKKHTNKTGVLYQIHLNARNPLYYDKKIREKLYYSITTALNSENLGKLALKTCLFSQPQKNLKKNTNYSFKNFPKMNIIYQKDLPQINKIFAAWEKNKIKVSKLKLSSKNFKNRLIRRNFRDMILFGIDLFYGGKEVVPKLNQKIPSLPNHYTGLNISGWRNPSAEKLTYQLNYTIDFKKKLTLIKKFSQIFYQDLYEIPLFYEEQSAYTSPNLKGFKLTTGYPSSFYSSSWRL